MNSEYQEYLLSEHWQKIRSERLKMDNFKCQNCGRPFDLQVHHLTYDRIGNEDINDLITLCKFCHARVEEGKKEYQSPLKKQYLEYKKRKSNHHDNVQNFIKEYEHRDLSNVGKGDLDLCSLDTVKKELHDYLSPLGDDIPSGASRVISFFARKRWAIILDYVEKSYPQHLCFNQTLFSKNMIQKIYKDPEKYKKFLNQGGFNHE